MGGQGGHVVVAQLLDVRGELAHDGPPLELQAVGLTLGQGAAVELKLERGPVELVARFWSREKDPLLILLKVTAIKTLHLIHTFKWWLWP